MQHTNPCGTICRQIRVNLYHSW